MNDHNKARINFYGNIITKIAIFLILFVFYQVQSRLSELELRLRSLELQVTAISARLGIDTEHRLSSANTATQKEREPVRGKLP